MQKPQASENKTSAIIRFFLGLCSLMLLLFLLYYLVAIRDWSYLAGDRVAADAVRASVDEPSPFETPAVPAGQAEATAAAESVWTPAPVAPTATPKPTPTPPPTAAPSPTPEPTRIPASQLSSYRSRSFNMPESGDNGQYGISRCYISKPDGYQVMVLEGWCYIEDELFNGMNSTTYLVTTHESTGKKVLYQATNIAGISERSHSSVCMNPEAADWRVTLSAADYADGVYNLAVGLGYKPSGSGKTTYVVFPFDAAYSFTVLGGEVINAVPLTEE